MIPADMVGDGERRSLRDRVEELERELRERDQRIAGLLATQTGFRRIVETSPDVITRHRLDLTVSYVSPAIRTVLGIDPEEALGSRLIVLAHPQDAEAVAAAYREALAGGSGRVTARMRRADGGYADLEMLVSPVLDHDGQVTELICRARDVGWRVSAQRELAETHLLMSHTEELATLGSWSYVPSSEDMWWSDQMHRMIGTDPQRDTPTLARYLGWVDPADRDLVARTVAEVVEGRREGLAYAYRTIGADGSTRHVHTTGIVERDAEGRMVRMLGYSRDITDTQLIEQKLLAARTDADEKARLMAQAQRIAGVGSWSMDAHTGRPFWSDELLRIYGLPPGGTPRSMEELLAFIVPSDRELVAAATEEALRTGESHNYEHRIRRGDGEIRVLHVNAQADLDEEGRPVRLAGTVQDVTERRQVEQELITARDTLAVAQRMSGIGSWTWDVTTNAISWSDEMVRVFGREQGPADYGVYLSWIHPEDQELLNGAIQQMLADHQPYDIEYRFLLPDGSVRLLRALGRLFLDENGTPILAAGTGEDVTDRRTAERELTEARDLLDEAQRISGVGSWSLDLITGEVIWSDQMHRLLGRAYQGPYTTESYYATVLPEDIADVTVAVQRSIEEDLPYDKEHRVLRADGEVRLFHTKGWVERTEGGTPLRLSGTAEDITERRAAERELTEARDELAEAQRISGVGSWVIDFVTDTVLWSEQECRLYGLTQETVPRTTREFLPVMHPDDRQALIDTIREDAEQHRRKGGLEYRIRRPDGEVRLLSSLWRLEYAADGTLARLSGTSEDVTERRANERELRMARDGLAEAQRISGVGSFTHDLVTGATEWSEQQRRLFGVGTGEPPIVWPAFLDLVHPEDREELSRYRAEGMATGRVESRAEFRVVHPDGRVRLLEYRWRTQFDADGRALSIAGSSEDITERRETERQLTETRDLLTEAQRIAGLGSWTYDLTTDEVRWSDQMCRLLGVDPADGPFTNDSYVAVLIPEDRERVVAEVERSVEAQSPYESEHRIRRVDDGERRILHTKARVEVDANGRPIRMSGSTEDVTDRRRAEDELTAARDGLAEAQRISGVGSWSFSLADGSLTWSEQQARLYGIDPADAPATMDEHLAFVHPDDRETVVAPPEGAGDEGRRELRIIRNDGHVRTLEIRWRVETDDQGTPTAVTGTAEDITERMETQRQLTEARDLLVKLINSPIDQAIIMRDNQGGITLWNKGAERMLGYTAEEMVGQAGVPSLHLPEEWVQHLPMENADDDDLFRRAVDPDDPHADPHQWTFVRKDGEHIQAHLSVKRMRDAQGVDIGAIGIATDITERRRMERELLEARDLFRQLLGAATGQAIIATDVEGRVTIFNRGAELLIGRTAEEVLGRSWAVNHDPDQIRGWFGTYEPGDEPSPASAVPEEAGVVEVTLVRPDDSRFQAEMSFTRMLDPEGRLTGFLAIATDVTAQREIERERDEHAAMLRAIIDHDQSLIYVRDLDDRFLLVNKAFEKALGLSEDEVLGATGLAPHFQADRVWAQQRQLALQGTHESLDVVELADGTHYFEAVKLPLRDAQGFVYAICGISHDVTTQRQAELDSQAAMDAMGEARDRALEANAAKSSFLATMSHEIRTPMNAVIGLTGLLLDGNLDDEQRDLLQTVRSSGDQLLAIINDILDFSKVEAGELDLEQRAFDLRELVTRTVAQTSAIATGLELGSEVDPDVPHFVVGDQTRLRQVLSNLLGNAVKFTTEGSVHVRVSAQSARRGGEAGMVLRFDVRDTGIGIPEDAMHRLFRSFSQVDASTTRVYGGTGLGLAICRGLTEAMGGKIWVESQVGRGSTFSFTVVVGTDVPSASGDEASRHRPGTVGGVPAPRDGGATAEGAGGLHVLLAEDNLVNQKVGTLMLGRLGHTVEVADNGRLAVAAAHARRFDVILMDMHMPEMDGLEATRRIRAELPPDRQPYIVALTASVTQEDRDACAAAGMNAYVSKPVRLDDLAAAFAVAVAERVGSD